MEVLGQQDLTYKNCVSLEEKYSCTVIVVSKKQSVEKMQKAYTQGFRHFAESYVQEALGKQEVLKQCCPDIVWHFIGNIQSNKLKWILPNFSYLHSVSSLKLVNKILDYKWSENKKNSVLNKEAVCKKNNLFLQVNISKDSKKRGFLLKDNEFNLNKRLEQGSDFLKSIDKINQSSQFVLKGFMTMPFFYTESQLIKVDFQKLQSLAIMYSKYLGYNLDTSMGISRDYSLALAAGSKWVRLGEILLGTRA